MAKLTPTTYFEAPSFSAVIPNNDLKLAIYVQTSYSFSSHANRVQLKLLDLSTDENEPTVLLEDDKLTTPCWLNTEQIAWLSAKDSGNTAVVVANVKDVDKRYTVGTVPGPASHLRVKALRDGSIAIAFAVKINEDGTVYNPSDEPKRLTTAKYYDKNYTRHWDSWIVSAKAAIFYGALEMNDNKKYKLSNISNACRPDLESPIPPFGDTGDYDLGENGIVFLAGDPSLNLSLHTKVDCYFTPIPDYRLAGKKTVTIPTLDLKGAAKSPIISPSGKDLVFMKQEIDGYESDRNRIVLVRGFDSNPQATILNTGDWNLNPSDVCYHRDDSLILTADFSGVTSAYLLPIDNEQRAKPKRITHPGTISNIRCTNTGSFLLGQSTLCHPGSVGVFANAEVEPSCMIHLTRELLSPQQISETWWDGAAQRVHGLIMKPSHFNDSQTYPVCFLIHGGPQDCFHNAWASYYSVIPQIFAEAGYIVVMPQITGSTGYGYDFTHAIQKDWGGAPYEDIRTCFEHVKQNMPAADTSRAILGGLSFGGWMANWVQGHDFGREFKALFTLNGIFSSDAFLATEELFFPQADLGGLPWESAEARAIWQRWDPSAHVANWATPHLIVHTEKDFRCGIEHGIAAFNVLQAKGVPSGFLAFEDEAHVVVNPENLRVMYQVLLRFVNSYVGLDPPDVAEGEEGVLPLR